MVAFTLVSLRIYLGFRIESRLLFRPAPFFLQHNCPDRDAGRDMGGRIPTWIEVHTQDSNLRTPPVPNS